MLLALLACADPWTAAQEVCGTDDGAPLPFSAATALPSGGAWHDVIPPAGCADHLVRAVGGSPDRLLHALGDDGDLDGHLEAVRTGARDPDGLAALAWGLYWLVASDFGTIDGLMADPYFDAEWAETFARDARARGLDGDAPAAQLFYDIVTTRTLSVGWMPDDAPVGAGMGMQGGVVGTLRIARSFDTSLGWTTLPWSPTDAAESLVHEAMHARVGRLHHVGCDADNQQAEGAFCDADTSRAYGAGFAARWAQGRVAVDAFCADGDVSAAWFAQDAEDDIRVAWEAFVLTDVPLWSGVDCG